MASFEVLMGPLLVLVCLALILYGTFTTQVYYYWSNYPEDSTFLRCLVLAIWILESLHSAFCIHMLYTYFILHFGDTTELDTIFWSAVATILIEIVVVSLTQMFFIYRIWKLSRNNYVVASVPACLLLCRIVLGLVAASFLYRYDTWSAFRQRKGSRLALNVALSCGGLVDLLTTAILSYYLYRRRSTFPRTRLIIDKLMFFSLNTGALTVVFSIVILLTYNLVTNSLFWAGMVEIISKLYANSMLAMLNARHGIRYGDATSDSTSVPLERQRRSGIAMNPPGTSDSICIEIHKETRTDYEHAPSVRETTDSNIV